MSDTADIDHENTRDIVCPHCGYTYAHSTEFLDGRTMDGAEDCADCGKRFTWFAEFDITYCTGKV